jgi:hypothetical protein
VQHIAYHKPPTYVQADATAPETPVVMVPEAPETAATTAQVLPAAGGSHSSPFLFFIPAAVGGIVAGLTHGSPSPPPSCTEGSNATFACSH